MVVLDTTFIIHFLNNKKNAIEKANTFSEPVSTTRLNVFEVLVGIHSKKSEETENALLFFNDFLYSVKVLELDQKSAELAARISAELNRKGQTVYDNDILIAAIALTNNENTIITENVKDFSKIKGLKIEKY